MYADFNLLVPVELDEALGMMADQNSQGSCAPLGGGTNLIVEMRASGAGVETLISVGQIPALRNITIADGKVTLGGATTVSDILRHDGLVKAGGALVDAVNVFAGQMVRNTATFAGNICCGSPAADLVPPLLALGATVTLQSKSGQRDMPLADYFTGYKQSLRKPDELLTAVSWSLPNANSASRFYKLARRKGDAITVLGVAVALEMESGICKTARIALGAAGPVVLRAIGAEAMLQGQVLTPKIIEAAAAQAREEAQPIDDVRASGEYRKQQVQVLVRRLLVQTSESLA